jgi:hypothetical protein
LIYKFAIYQRVKIKTFGATHVLVEKPLVGIGLVIFPRQRVGQRLVAQLGHHPRHLRQRDNEKIFNWLQVFPDFLGAKNREKGTKMATNIQDCHKIYQNGDKNTKRT